MHKEMTEVGPFGKDKVLHRHVAREAILIGTIPVEWTIPPPSPPPPPSSLCRFAHLEGPAYITHIGLSVPAVLPESY